MKRMTMVQLEKMLARTAAPNVQLVNIDIIQGRLDENVKVVAMAGPALLNSGAFTGDYVSMKMYRRVEIIIALAPASGTDPSAVTLKQAKTVDNSPVTEKALPFSRMKRILPDVSDEEVETAVTNDTFNTSATAQREIFRIDVEETSLDIDNGFDCIRVNMTDPGSVSTPAVVLGVCYEAKQKTAPLPSAIVD